MVYELLSFRCVSLKNKIGMLCFFILLTYCCAFVAVLKFCTFMCAAVMVVPYGIWFGWSLFDRWPCFSCFGVFVTTCWYRFALLGVVLLFVVLVGCCCCCLLCVGPVCLLFCLFPSKSVDLIFFLLGICDFFRKMRSLLLFLRERKTVFCAFEEWAASVVPEGFLRTFGGSNPVCSTPIVALQDRYSRLLDALLTDLGLLLTLESDVAFCFCSLLGGLFLHLSEDEIIRQIRFRLLISCM